MGESITDAVIAKWLKKAGDIIDKDEIIVELETDKVTQEIYAPNKGKITKVLFKEGEEVKVGEIIANIKEIEKSNTEEEKKLDEKSDKKIELYQIRIPSLGESITEATIGKWLKSIGDYLKKDEPIVEVETDKVTQELYAENSGVLKEIIFQEQEEVKIGESIGIIEIRDEEENIIAKKPNLTISSDSRNTTEQKILDPNVVKRSGLNNKINLNDLKEFIGDVSLSPSARKFINENSVDLEQLENISETGRVTKATLGNFESNKDNAKKENYYTNNLNTKDLIKPLSKMRQSIATRLKQAQNTAAMLTTFNEIDMTGVMEIRKNYKDKFIKKYSVKLGFMSFFTKACIIVLREIPEVNAEIKDNNIIYKNRYDIGIAVGTQKGLFVPILRGADKMSFSDIERNIQEFGILAKENKIKAEQMKDGTFTISNGGVYGSMLSTPILNGSQSGILGLHNIVKRAIVIKDEIVIRPVMYVALTYDHRIIDGQQAVTFLVKLKQIIENPEVMIFDT